MDEFVKVNCPECGKYLFEIPKIIIDSVKWDLKTMWESIQSIPSEVYLSDYRLACSNCGCLLHKNFDFVYNFFHKKHYNYLDKI